MQNESKKLIVRIVEYAALFALSAFLIRLGICCLIDVWWILLIVAAVATAAVVGWRVWKHKSGL